ncbi:MAG: hypothetical protein WAM44_20760, partial [Chthoniobacterales bacterium]
MPTAEALSLWARPLARFALLLILSSLPTGLMAQSLDWKPGPAADNTGSSASPAPTPVSPSASDIKAINDLLGSR